MTIAYTIGNQANYDRALARCRETNRPMRKIGKAPADDTNYPGGSVWRTPVGAETAALAATLAGPAVFGVYVLELPGTWEKCTHRWRGGDHLLVDAIITRKHEP